MTSLLSLPTEILREIILNIFLADQELPASAIINPDDDSAEALVEYAKCKIYTGSFVAGIDKVHYCRFENTGGEHYLKTLSLYENFRNGTMLQRQDILALSLTCHHLHESVQQIFWKVVEAVCEEGTQGGVDLGNILCPLYHNPSLQKYVKALSIHHYDILRSWRDEQYDRERRQQWRGNRSDGQIYEDFCNTEYLDLLDDEEKGRQGIQDLKARSASMDEIDDFISTWDENTQISALLSLLPNLITLNLSIDDPPALWKIFNFTNPSIDQLFPTSPRWNTLNNLTELSLIFEGIQEFHTRLSDSSFLLPTFFLPNLQTLYFGRLRTTFSYAPPFPLSITSRFKQSPIKNLNLGFYTGDSRTLESFMQLPKALETFSLSYGSFQSRSTRTPPPDAPQILHHLLPQRNSLRKLEIKGQYECPFGYTNKKASPVPPDLLSQFPKLSDLSISYTVLTPPTTSYYGLATVLPPILKKLELWIHDDVAMFCWKSEIERVFERKRRGEMAGLESVRVDMWEPRIYDMGGEGEGEEEVTYWAGVEGVSGWREGRRGLARELWEEGRGVGVEVVVSLVGV